MRGNEAAPKQQTKTKAMSASSQRATRLLARRAASSRAAAGPGCASEIPSGGLSRCPRCFAARLQSTARPLHKRPSSSVSCKFRPQPFKKLSKSPASAAMTTSILMVATLLVVDMTMMTPTPTTETTETRAREFRRPRERRTGSRGRPACRPWRVCRRPDHCRRRKRTTLRV